MTKKTITITLALWGAILGLAQVPRPDATIEITGQRGNLRIAVPEFRGPAVPASVNQAFNTTLWNDLESSGVLDMVSKSFYPAEAPQKPEDFKPPQAAPTAELRRPRPGDKQAPAPEPVRQGPWLTDWSQPPAQANVLAFGSTGVENDRFAVTGWLEQVLAKQLLGSLIASWYVFVHTSLFDCIFEFEREIFRIDLLFIVSEFQFTLHRYRSIELL